MSENASKEMWVDYIESCLASREVDLAVVHYLVRNNPSLCSGCRDEVAALNFAIRRQKQAQLLLLTEKDQLTKGNRKLRTTIRTLGKLFSELSARIKALKDGRGDQTTPLCTSTTSTSKLKSKRESEALQVVETGDGSYSHNHAPVLRGILEDINESIEEIRKDNEKLLHQRNLLSDYQSLLKTNNHEMEATIRATVLDFQKID